MKYLVLLLISLAACQAYGQKQVEKSIEVGQYVRINPCKGKSKEFQSMDEYARTKPYDKSKVDSLTGTGLLQEFFNDKSIDAKRLPCVNGGMKYKIAALHTFEENGQVRRVILCYTNYPLTLIWIELDKALELNEISFE